MTTSPLHTDDHQVPPLDDDLANVLDDLVAIHAGVDLIRSGIRLLALDRHTTDNTQTLLAALAGSNGADILTALAHLIARLSTADTNPALRHLPLNQQKAAQQHGEAAQFDLTDPDLHQHASEASAAITSH
ncbi:hypothetical protein OG298_45075 (plasmid) [Streptomyces sp. NBC_01005]|uniref:hypothetical protein n=1 Tax=Streptomyces sp. NBC_01005 TaxID=2903715 RepID=UPI002F90B1CC|nr:hypothetical protein OG298_45075 [Streptomyces sp. NBC_01005]